jgi:hypothetical protein
MKTQATSAVPAVIAAADLAVILQAEGFGPCAIVRTVTGRFQELVRGEMLAIAGALGLNAGTTARQFQEVRSAGVVIADAAVL